MKAPPGARRPVPAQYSEPFRLVLDRSGLSVKRVALFFHTSPEVVSGSTIFVPEKPEDNGSGAETWARVLGTASALTSILIAIVALKKL